MKKIAIALLTAGILSGCMSVGTKIDWNNARQVKDGMTKEQVVKLMGQPHTVAARADGSQRFVWVYVSTFSGSQTAALDFDAEGRVKKAFTVPDSF